MDVIIILIFGLFCYFIGGVSGRAVLPFVTHIRRRTTDYLSFQADRVLITLTIVTAGLVSYGGATYGIPYHILNLPELLQLLILLVGLAALLYATLVGNTPHQNRIKPALFIHPRDYSEADKQVFRQIVPTPSGIYHVDADAYYLRLIIHNQGFTQMRNVEVILEDITSAHGHNQKLLMNLQWSGTQGLGSKAMIHIPPQSSRFLDLIKIIKHDDLANAISALARMNIPYTRLVKQSLSMGLCPVITPATDEDILMESEYILRLTIMAENAEPLYVALQVLYDHIWDDNTTTMFHNHVALRLLALSPNRSTIFS